MITAILIEDELKVRQGLKKMINLVDNDIEIIAESGSVNESVRLINKLKPNLVFFDVELEDGTSFDILLKLNYIDFKVIFTTAYNQYALNAFKYATVDYLLKPIDPIELKEAIIRAKSTINTEQKHKELINLLRENENLKDKKIVLNTIEQRYIVFLKEIIRLEADGAYTVFHTSKAKILVSKNLKYYEDLLDDSFIRCHQSHLVNKKHISSIENNNFIKMSNNDLINISTRKRSLIKQILNSF